MKTAKIGIYKDGKSYFAVGISKVYMMREIENEDKHILAFKIRNRLNKRKIEYCFICPLKNCREEMYPIEKYELEAIASSMNFNTNNKNLIVKVNEEVYKNAR